MEKLDLLDLLSSLGLLQLHSDWVNSEFKT